MNRVPPALRLGGFGGMFGQSLFPPMSPMPSSSSMGGMSGMGGMYPFHSQQQHSKVLVKKKGKKKKKSGKERLPSKLVA